MTPTPAPARSIPVFPEHAQDLEAWMLEVNGRSKSKTFTTAKQLLRVARNAQAAFEETGAALDTPGAYYVAQSGNELPASYGPHGVKTTTVTMWRIAGAWHLVDAESETLFPGTLPTRELWVRAH